jgi:restriction endonuclease S subunit
VELCSVANIRTGVVLSRKEASALDYAAEYRALNLKSVSYDGLIAMDMLEPYYATERLKREYLTRERDILIRLSVPYTAVWVGEGNIDLLVPAHFAIIRVKPRLIDSYYLHWWLTQKRQIFYKMASGGTMMGTISSGYISDMRIDPPPLEQQRLIGEYLRLAKREQELLTALTNKKQLLTDAVAHQIETGGLSK